MPPSNPPRSGGRLLADQLAIHGTDRLFCVPGESFLDLLDGLYDHRNRIQVVCARHESGAANMAEAYAKMTGRPGVCAVTRGPGATHAANGVHTAFQDSTPMILLIGQVARRHIDREAFQEVDYRQMFGGIAKWVAQIDDAARIPEYLGRAFRLATSGRPGPVVLALPEDMLAETVDADDGRPAMATQAAPAPAAMAALRDHLARAERPLLILGGPTWTAEAVDAITRFAEACGLPVATAFRRQDRFDNRRDNFVGTVGIAIDPNLAERVRQADLLVVVGARLGDTTTQGYSLLDLPNPAQALVHVHPDPNEPGRVFAPDLAIAASVPHFAEALAGLAPVDGTRWRDWLAAARADYLAFLRPTAVPGPVNLGEVVAWLNERLPDDAVLTNGAGNYAVWLHRFYQYRAYPTQVAPTSGSMGYGVPAAIAAKLAAPDRIVVNISGDGCFQMLGQELATAAQYGAAAIFVVVNNGMLGTIRMHQESRHPGRVIGTGLDNPDFVALARAFGAFGERVERTADFPAAFERALAANRPAVIELAVDPAALTPTRTLGGAGGSPA